jgi:phosphoglycerol transferase MdoB-like AlkP superfamily enzyme
MRTGDPGKPVFASLAKVGTHIPCDGMPANRVVPIKSPRNIRERYINALSLADAQLSDFFAELTRHPEFSNSMVIITSDHSFPMREHGIYNNEICHYEESFRIPLLLIWDGALKPERVPERAYSQMDIGPTLCDLLGLYDDDNSMAGISIFDRTTPHPVFLVQPYNGTYLEVVDLPFKYTIQLSTGNESMFNLLEDPKEERDLSKMIDPSRLNSYKKQVEKIKANQQLVEENRIRP